MKNKDPRTRYTEKMIQNEMIRLLSEKPINKITVQEICTGVMINRSTFYDHYVDIYDLFDKTEEAFIKQALEIHEPQKTPSGIEERKETYLKLCSFYQENKELFLTYDGPNGDPDFIRKISDGIIAWTGELAKETRLNYQSEIEQKMALIYLTEGTYAIIYDWLKNHPELSKESVADLLCRLNFRGIDA